MKIFVILAVAALLPTACQSNRTNLDDVAYTSGSGGYVSKLDPKDM